jgi:hypothetical protein
VQQREILAGEWLVPVVLFLVPDVISQRCIVGTADRECSVTMLPAEVSAMGITLVNPAGSVGLDDSYQLRNRDSGRRLNI